jgi:formiminoglutamase
MAFHFLDSLIDFLEPINKAALSEDVGFKEAQLGYLIDAFEQGLPDIENADLIIIGCNETRGATLFEQEANAADEVRKQFYNLYKWHSDVRIADIGNIKQGADLSDTYAALKAVIKELNSFNKKLLILGGSHDLMLAQYEACAEAKKIIEAVCVDAKIDLDSEADFAAENFLMQMLTSQPNFVKHYNHIAFQSYFVYPAMLETIDKLGFDCFRVGKVKENIAEMEPVIRNANILSLDISAIQNSYAPANILTPNGLNGEEACVLMQYAGMSSNISTVGLYGYLPNNDRNKLTAKQLSQMAWYLLDGIQSGKEEATMGDRQSFNEFHLAFADIQSTFLQSKKTGRWWMKLPDESYTACSHNDYILASQNEIPERWLRAVERS